MCSPLLLGRWRLLFTTRPGSASPIQRAFTGVEGFDVYQCVEPAAPGRPLTVANVVQFGSAGTLRVEAEASTVAQPLPGFTPRVGAGIPLLGKSSNTPPPTPGSRVDFAFDKAAFFFKALPFSIP